MDYRSALSQPSGVGAYARGLARALVRDAAADPVGGVALTVFSSSWKDRLTLDDDLAGASRVDRRVPVRVLNALWHRAGWPPIEQLAGQPFDVAHSLHPLLMPARAAAQVTTIFDLNFLSHPERTRAEIRRDYPSLVHAHAARADQIVVCSRFTAQEVETRLGVPSERITTCYPGGPDWAPRAAAPQGGYLLFVGTLEPRKNVGTLLDAYERLLARASDPASVPELVLAGRALPETQGWLDRIARPPLAGRVRHLGYFAPSDARRLYEGARLVVQPSWEEGFGLPVLEAMTLGVPVVAANRGSLPEVLGDAGLLVDPEDADALAAALRRMLDEPSLAAACAAAGVARARLFTWAAGVTAIREAYQRAVERRRRRA